MTDPKPLNRDAAKQNPESAFDSPLDIVDETLLTKGEKVATLDRWRQSILEQLSASNEGMQTRGHSADQLRVLKEIDEAKSKLA